MRSDNKNQEITMAIEEEEEMNYSNIEVCASAPGKVILFGEHAVVYGEPAVAASLNNSRIYVHVSTTGSLQLLSGGGDDDDTATTKNNNVIRINMPDLSLNFSTKSNRFLRMEKLRTPPTKNCIHLIRQLIIETWENTTTNNEAKTDASVLQLSALTPVLYLLNELVPPDFILNHNIFVSVRSDIPVGAGLGSSAAFGVATAACFIQLTTQYNKNRNQEQQEGTDDNTDNTVYPNIPDPDVLKKIDEYAFYSEILLHETPSGVDNAVSSNGGAVLFKKVGGKTSMERIPMHHDYDNDNDDSHKLNLLLVNSGVPRSTKQQVGNVRKLYIEYEWAEYVLKAMGAIASQFTDKLKQSNTSNLNLDYVLELVRTNQYLLRLVGVSHPKLDDICRLTEIASGGQAAAKLTGAGGGGCAMVLFKDSSTINKVQRKLEKYGYECFSSSVGGPGVWYMNPKAFPLKTITAKQQQQQRGIGRRTSAAAVDLCRSWLPSINNADSISIGGWVVSITAATTIGIAIGWYGSSKRK